MIKMVDDTVNLKSFELFMGLQQRSPLLTTSKFDPCIVITMVMVSSACVLLFCCFLFCCLKVGMACQSVCARSSISGLGCDWWTVTLLRCPSNNMEPRWCWKDGCEGRGSHAPPLPTYLSAPTSAMSAAFGSSPLLTVKLFLNTFSPHYHSYLNLFYFICCIWVLPWFFLLFILAFIHPEAGMYNHFGNKFNTYHLLIICLCG